MKINLPNSWVIKKQIMPVTLRYYIRPVTTMAVKVPKQLWRNIVILKI